MSDLPINPKKYETGTVVYYIKKYGHKWSVDFATVVEDYPSCIVLQRYETKDTRRICGVPVKEFVTPTRWMKLPKGWNYDSELVDVRFDLLPVLPNDLFFTDPQSLLTAIQAGFYVPVQDNDHAQFRAEIDAKKGWRIVRDYTDELCKHNFWITSVRYDEVYGCYDDALAAVDAHEKELRRQAALTEEEWSIEQIDHELDRWAALYGIPDDTKNQYRDWILGLEHIEDVEVRLLSGEIQWKYWKNKKWKNIEL